MSENNIIYIKNSNMKIFLRDSKTGLKEFTPYDFILLALFKIYNT